MKKTIIGIDEYGEPIAPYEKIEFDEVEQEEIQNAEETLKKYNL